MMKKFMLGLAVLALSVSAFAQRGGGMMMRMGGNNSMFLLRRGDVQKDLGMTDDQKSKITAIQDKAREDMQSFFQANMSGGERPDFEKLRPQMEAMQKDIKAKIDAVLTPDQSKRVEEIGIQLDGNRAALRPDLQPKLGITDDQKAALKKLVDNEQQANADIREKVQNGDITREQSGDLRRKNQKIMLDELGKILTQAQRDQIKALGGKPFTAEPQEDRGPGGPPPVR